MKIKEHFNKMLITLGWAITGSAVLCVLGFAIGQLFNILKLGS